MKMGEMKFVDKVREKFDLKFPFGLLSNVILYRNDRNDTDLFANEIDYLFHYMNNGKDHLVIVEVKDREDMYGNTPSQLPTEESPWKLFYDKEKDIKKQVQDQAKALKQFCDNIPNKSRPVIECWIVHKRKYIQRIIQDKSNNRLKLLTFEGFEYQINQIRDVVRVEHSDFLRELRRGVISPDTGHPEIPNAIQFIDICRKSLDDQIYSFFTPKKRYHAINGCAGMGKSVLLAYSIYVFASNYKVEHKNRELMDFEEESKKIGLPIHKERKIYAYAVKKKQIEALEDYWEKIIEQIAVIKSDSQPHLQKPVFEKWKGEIPPDCNILIIDESHDLSPDDQKNIAEWINQDNNSSSKYLLVACDRNQALKRKDNEENIIAGIKFSRHSTRLNRIYRCPFPVYVASIGLMFRWFASEGAKVLLSTDRLREHFGFQPQIEEDNDCISLTMRSDCHPGNNWNQTVSFFQNCDIALKHLSQFHFEEKKEKNVLWASFQKTDSDFDYQKIKGKYTYVNLRTDADEEIDKDIKGQEFSIVIIEGLPLNMNPQDLSDKEDWGKEPSKSELEMWKCRRNLYVVCSRASAFLYFIADIDRSSSDANIQELKNFIEQVSVPFRGKHEPGQTWKFRITNPSIKRNPLVFKDIEDTEEKDIEESMPESKDIFLPDINIEKPKLKDLEYTEENILVAPLSKALWITTNKLQELLPDDSRAKYNSSIGIKLSDAIDIAKQLGYNFIRIRHKKDSKNNNVEEKIITSESISAIEDEIADFKIETELEYIQKDFSDDVEDTEEKDIKESASVKPKRVVDISGISTRSKLAEAFGITKEEFDDMIGYQQNLKLKKSDIIEVAAKLGIELKSTQKDSLDYDDANNPSVNLSKTDLIFNKPTISIKQSHNSAISSPERRIIKENNTSTFIVQPTQEYSPARPSVQKKGDEHKQLGRKGFKQVEHYLIPVIRFMKKGKSHKEAFDLVAKELGVEYSTVASQCTRTLDIDTEEFKEKVQNGQIIRLIKNKYPEKSEMINRELGEYSQERYFSYNR